MYFVKSVTRMGSITRVNMFVVGDVRYAVACDWEEAACTLEQEWFDGGELMVYFKTVLLNNWLH